MSYYPDGCTQRDIDESVEEYGGRCNHCGQNPCECCTSCGAQPDKACEPWCGFPEYEADIDPTPDDYGQERYAETEF